MSIRFTAGVLGIALSAALACRGVPSAVPIAADRASLDALVGSWSGEYESPVTGRTGTIQFTIRPGVDTVYGDVVMIPKHAVQADPTHTGNPAGSGYVVPQPLQIRFVRLAGGEVNGVMAPYTDPECGCEVTTSFRGRVEGDRIAGSFRTTGRGVATTGSWRVVRKAQS